MEGIVQVRDLIVAAVRRERVHGEVVGAEREEVAGASQRIRCERCARRLDHDAERGCIADRHALARQPAHHLVHGLAHLPDLVDRGDHRHQDAHRPVGTGPQNRRDLRLQKCRRLEREADGAQPERRIDARRDVLAQGVGELVRAHVEGAHGHRRPVHAGNDLLDGDELLVLARRLLAVHVEELAAQEPDALGARFLRLRQLVGQLDVALQGHAFAVGGYGWDLAQPGELALAPLQRAAPALEPRDRRLAGVDHEPTAHAVHRHDVARAHGAGQASDAQHGRQSERARHDRGMPLGPALCCGEAADARRVHQRGIRRRDLLGDDDGAGRQAGECLITRPGQVVHEARARFAHVDDLAGEIGILHPCEGLRDLRELHLDRRLGVDARIPDADLDAAHEP